MRRSTGRSPWSRKTRRAPPEGTPVNERRAGSSRPTGQAVSGTNGRMISAPTEWAVTRRLRGAPRPFGGRHRRRPGGPGRYNAAAVRACRVIDAGPQGAAAPVTKPKKVPGVDARPVLALSVQLSAAMNPRIGGSRVGEAPRPFFPPISSGRNGGARRAGIRREAGLHQTGGYYPPLRAWQLAYRAGQARTLADGGPGRTPQMGRPPRRHRGTPHPPQ